MYSLYIICVSGIELLHNHAFLQSPGHLYMHRRETCYVLCRYYDINFYVPIDNYRSIETELVITLKAANSTCSKIKQEKECIELMKNLWSESGDLEAVSKRVHRYYDHKTCSKRDKRDALTQYHMYYSTTTDSEHSLSLLKYTLERLLLTTKPFLDQTPETPIDEQVLNLFHLLENISLALQHNIMLNRFIIDIVCEEDKNAFLAMITPRILTEKIIRLNKTAVSESCKLPELDDIANVKQFLEMAHMSFDMIADIFSVNLKLPSIHKPKYHLYQVISLPFAVHNFSYVIKPSHPYYLISEIPMGRETFIYPIQTENMKECQNAFFGKFCQPTTPLHLTSVLYENQREILPEIEKCAYKHINEISAETSKCEIFSIPHRNKIIKITNNTHFLYIIHPTTAVVRCPYGSEKLAISESSLTGIKDGCTLKLLPDIVPEEDTIFMQNENFVYNKNETNIFLNTKKPEESNFLGLQIWHVALMLSFLLLFIVTWILVAYNNHQFLKHIRRFVTNWQNQPRNNQPINFDCEFSFLKPATPPHKKHSIVRLNHKKEKSHYDTPRNNSLKLFEEIDVELI